MPYKDIHGGDIPGYSEQLGTTTAFGYYVSTAQKNPAGLEVDVHVTDGPKQKWVYVQATTDDISPNVMCLWAEATTGRYVTDDWTLSVALTTDQYGSIAAGVSKTTITSSYWGWLQKTGWTTGIKKTSSATADALAAGQPITVGQSTTDDGAVIGIPKTQTADTTAAVTVYYLPKIGVNLVALGSTTNATGMVILQIP